MSIKSKIRTIKNYPIEGVMFRDITTLLNDPSGFKEVIDDFYNRYKDLKIDKIVAVEARGFIIGAPLAYLLNIGLVIIRKPGKLPSKTIFEEYDLEYGTDKIEIHIDSIKKGERVLIVDDLIATGGTVAAAVRLVEKMEAEIIECCFVIDLPDIGGRERLQNMGQKVFTLCEFEGE
ncbi:adenine phosphoribosyltransferase [Candidatus Pseudothioglobus singularis]|uniref:Adenine phosphoribosyltransferase n=1 Tax=Candidatus Pseudothioglobus singularis PS1 TaxID=1125411 RepID=A0A0M4LQI4_9GAMM|nr:adenine phosphoribosyltransferase [Candidatus Pseudothioglobus singularis]ALE02309.1 adenine phosphoribosyltransferase [Candidatus Pseudothioglobus singularis PS1]